MRLREFMRKVDRSDVRLLWEPRSHTSCSTTLRECAMRHAFSICCDGVRNGCALSPFEGGEHLMTLRLSVGICHRVCIRCVNPGSRG
jgi:hypothetical protein